MEGPFDLSGDLDGSSFRSFDANEPSVVGSVGEKNTFRKTFFFFTFHCLFFNILQVCIKFLDLLTG